MDKSLSNPTFQDIQYLGVCTSTMQEVRE